jgi:hypothetical protein
MARNIPQSEWRTFFDQLSRDHEGWLTTVEIVGGEVGDEIEVEELPLAGIGADTRGSAQGSIEVTVGEDAEDQETHIIHDAERVVYDEAEGGAKLLQIISADGERTIVKMRTAQRRAGGRE